MAPPPITSRDAGTASAAIASRFVQCGTASNIGGTQARCPVARTNARRAVTLTPDLDGRGSSDAGDATDEMAALALETLDGHGVVPRVSGFVTNAPRHRRPVRRDGRRAGHARYAPALGQEVRGTDDHFGGDAPPVRALASDQLRLDADDVESRLGQAPGDLLAPRAEADDDGIDLHRDYSPPQFVTLTGATIGVPTTSWIW